MPEICLCVYMCVCGVSAAQQSCLSCPDEAAENFVVTSVTVTVLLCHSDSDVNTICFEDDLSKFIKPMLRRMRTFSLLYQMLRQCVCADVFLSVVVFAMV